MANIIQSSQRNDSPLLVNKQRWTKKDERKETERKRDDRNNVKSSAPVWIRSSGRHRPNWITISASSGVNCSKQIDQAVRDRCWPGEGLSDDPTHWYSDRSPPKKEISLRGNRYRKWIKWHPNGNMVIDSNILKQRWTYPNIQFG